MIVAGLPTACIRCAEAAFVIECFGASDVLAARLACFTSSDAAFFAEFWFQFGQRRQYPGDHAFRRVAGSEDRGADGVTESPHPGCFWTRHGIHRNSIRPPRAEQARLIGGKR